MKLEEPNAELVGHANKICNYGLTVDDGKLYHLACFESLLAEEHGFVHANGMQPVFHDPVLGDYVRQIFAETRGPAYRTKASLWQLPKVFQYAFEVWKAVNEYDNTPDRSLRVNHVSQAVKQLGHDHIRKRGPDGTIYTTKQSMELCADMERVEIPLEMSSSKSQRQAAEYIPYPWGALGDQLARPLGRGRHISPSLHRVARRAWRCYQRC